MGDYNERINKRLRTVDNREERMEDGSNPNSQQESDLYEHIREGEQNHDAQTYGQSQEMTHAFLSSNIYLIKPPAFSVETLPSDVFKCC